MPRGRRLVAQTDASTSHVLIGSDGPSKIISQGTRFSSGQEGHLALDLEDIFFRCPKENGGVIRRNDEDNARSRVRAYINFLVEQGVNPLNMESGEELHAYLGYNHITGQSGYQTYVDNARRRNGAPYSKSYRNDLLTVANSVNYIFAYRWPFVIRSLRQLGHTPFTKTSAIVENRRIITKVTTATAQENLIESLVSAALAAAQNNTQEG